MGRVWQPGSDRRSLRGPVGIRAALWLVHGEWGGTRVGECLWLGLPLGYPKSTLLSAWRHGDMVTSFAFYLLPLALLQRSTPSASLPFQTLNNLHVS